MGKLRPKEATGVVGVSGQSETELDIEAEPPTFQCLAAQPGSWAPQTLFPGVGGGLRLLSPWQKPHAVSLSRDAQGLAQLLPALLGSTSSSRPRRKYHFLSGLRGPCQVDTALPTAAPSPIRGGGGVVVVVPEADQERGGGELESFRVS